MPDIKHFDPDVALERLELLFWRNGAAPTSIQDVAEATGLNRSSLYSTFGGKGELYRAAMRRYFEQRARPAFEWLAAQDRGLPAVREFFAGLVDVRCRGEFAGWGCLFVNAYADQGDPSVRALLDEHHESLRNALRAALLVAEREGQLAKGVSIECAAEMFALLAYGVNTRSRAGSDADALLRMVDATLERFARQ